MGIAQSVLMAGDLQPHAQTALFEIYNNTDAGLVIPSSDANYANLYPGTSDFCWETWIKPFGWYNQPAPLVAWDVTNAGGSQTFGLSIRPDATGGAAGIIGFTIVLSGYTSTEIATLPATYWNTFFHVAFAKIGTTIKCWAAGILVAEITGVTTALDLATLGGNGHWLFTGPVGDRDETYLFPLGCKFRNMRYVIGSSVYGNVSTITPPSLTANIPAITGTQYIIYPSPTSEIRYGGTYVPDYDGASWQFQPRNGSTQANYPTNVLYTYPSDTQITVSGYPAFPQLKGTWTNNGTNPNQPKITTAGPTPLYGTSCGDFTATGTDVRISSSDSAMADFTQSLVYYIWFYVPANITNECKSIISVETTNGFQLNIGRPGQGLDWVSIYTFGGSEQAYAPHIWARNAWNFLCIQRVNEGSGGPLSAWAGANGDTIATNLNLTDTGGSTAVFASSGTVSIGCPSGSTVSCQMYFNQILGFAEYNGLAAIYASNAPTIPIIPIPSQFYSSEAICFDFQGTNGDTNIQPIAP